MTWGIRQVLTPVSAPVSDGSITFSFDTVTDPLQENDWLLVWLGCQSSTIPVTQPDFAPFHYIQQYQSHSGSTGDQNLNLVMFTRQYNGETPTYTFNLPSSSAESDALVVGLAYYNTIEGFYYIADRIIGDYGTPIQVDYATPEYGVQYIVFSVGYAFASDVSIPAATPNSLAEWQDELSS